MTLIRLNIVLLILTVASCAIGQCDFMTWKCPPLEKEQPQ